MGAEQNYSPACLPRNAPGMEREEDGPRSLRDDPRQAFYSKRETEAGEGKAAAKVVPLMTQVPASALAMPLPFSLPATTDQAPTVGSSVGTLGLMKLLFTPREFIAKREETRK